MRSEPAFFLLAFAFSWSIWLPVAVTGADPSLLRHLAVGLAAAGPSVAGVVCTRREEGWTGVGRLVASAVRWRVGERWYALSLGGPIAVALVAVAVHRLVVGDDAEFRLATATVLLVPPALVAGVFLGSLQEELGWRGYALPRLRRRWGSLRASLVLGAAWACWHLPLYGIDGGGPQRAPLAPFLISVVALAFLYTWLWVVTGGSLLLALLFHSATNVAGVLLLKDANSDFGPFSLATVLTVALAVVAAHRLRLAEPAAGEEGGV